MVIRHWLQQSSENRGPLSDWLQDGGLTTAFMSIDFNAALQLGESYAINDQYNTLTNCFSYGIPSFATSMISSHPLEV